MTIYRVAWKRNNISLWQWKSTKLGTPHAVLGFLRLYHAVPAERMRVFSASSLEDLDRQLAQVNEYEALIAAIKLRQQEMKEETEGTEEAEKIKETVREKSQAERDIHEQDVFAARLTASLNENTVYVPASNGSMDWLGQRRLEYEMGLGGDHDLPYTFALPDSMPQRLAWTRLLGRVQRGELEL